jgi:hypothetical protein
MTTQSPHSLAGEKLPKQSPPALEDYPAEVLEAVLGILRAQQRKQSHERGTEAG